MLCSAIPFSLHFVSLTLFLHDTAWLSICIAWDRHLHYFYTSFYHQSFTLLCYDTQRRTYSDETREWSAMGDWICFTSDFTVFFALVECNGVPQACGISNGVCSIERKSPVRWATLLVYVLFAMV